MKIHVLLTLCVQHVIMLLNVLALNHCLMEIHTVTAIEWSLKMFQSVNLMDSAQVKWLAYKISAKIHA
jgi:hypothetical protein